MRDVLDLERSERHRLLIEGARTVTFAAFAPRAPFETWIVPHAPASSFLEADDATVEEAATALCRVLVAYDRVLAEPPHNVLLVTAPRDAGPGFRWHLVVLPRLAAFAGFELLTGGTLVGTAPEEAARLLRERL